MITTIIKCSPITKGCLRSYSITQINNGVRKTYDMIASNGKAALAMMRTMQTGSAS